MKQTAVEYLVEQLMPKALTAEQYYHIEQAKQMEKEQIINAYYTGHDDVKDNPDREAEQYYNETFNKK